MVSSFDPGTEQQIDTALVSVTFPFVVHWELVLLVLHPQLHGVLHWQRPDNTRVSIGVESNKPYVNQSRCQMQESGNLGTNLGADLPSQEGKFLTSQDLTNHA